MNDAIRMQLSAFVDGELPENEAELLLRRMSQDAELRHEVAEYLAIGRLMREEPGLSAADRLHRRVAAEIDDHDHPMEGQEAPVVATTSWATRPLTGVAVAATVALVAIFALQQSSVNELDSPLPTETVQEVNTPVPSIDIQEERQRALFRKHAETTSAFGANGMNSRVVTLQLSEELGLEQDSEATDAADAVAPPEQVTQP